MTVKRHHLKGFTMIEMMVALVLTALTVSLVYTGIRLVQRQGASLSAQLDTFAAFNRLHRILQADAAKCAVIRFNGSGFDFHKNGQVVQYFVSDSACVRQQGLMADTFAIVIDSVGCWFQDAPQPSAGGPVDQGALYVTANGAGIPISIEKHYDAASLMRLTDSTAAR